MDLLSTAPRVFAVDSRRRCYRPQTSLTVQCTYVSDRDEQRELVEVCSHCVIPVIAQYVPFRSFGHWNNVLAFNETLHTLRIDGDLMLDSKQSRIFHLFSTCEDQNVLCNAQ